MAHDDYYFKAVKCLEQAQDMYQTTDDDQLIAIGHQLAVATENAIYYLALKQTALDLTDIKDDIQLLHTVAEKNYIELYSENYVDDHLGILESFFDTAIQPSKAEIVDALNGISAYLTRIKQEQPPFEHH